MQPKDSKTVEITIYCDFVDEEHNILYFFPYSNLTLKRTNDKFRLTQIGAIAKRECMFFFKQELWVSESLRILFEGPEKGGAQQKSIEANVIVNVHASRNENGAESNLRILYAHENPDSSATIISKWEL